MDNPKKRNHSFSIIIIFSALIIVGLSFIPLLSVQLNPSQTLPSITVSYAWHNSSPEIIEMEATGKLEGILSTIKGINKISSVSSKGKASITVSFDKYTDMDFTRFEVASLIRQIYPKLPKEISYPKISVNRPDDEKIKPLLTYTLNGDDASINIQNYANDNIKKKLSLIEGINNIEVYGATPFEWQIIYDRNLLQTLNITKEDISSGIRQYFDRQALGLANINTSKVDSIRFVSHIPLMLMNRTSDSIDWSAIPVKKVGNRIILLTDIAEIKYIEQKPSAYFRINGLNTIYLVIYPDKGVNNLIVAKKIKERIKRIKTELPSDYYLLLSSDTTVYINEELTKIYWRTAFTVIILLLFVILVSRNLRYVLAIFISLFANISICFIFYYLLKIEIHLYSLAGITISLGLIIDNSIVMIDHMRHQHNKRVFISILASTLTTIAALSIIFFLPEKVKLNLWDFASIVIVNLSVSLVISLFFIPALVEKLNLLKQYKKLKSTRKRRIIIATNVYSRVITFLSRYKKPAFLIAILSFGIPVFMLPNKVEEDKWYSDIYNKTLGTEWYIDNVKSVVNKVFGGTLRLFSYYVFEGYYYSEPQQTILYVHASMPKGSTVHQLNDVYFQLENYLSQFSEIDKYITHVYSGQNGSMTICFKNEFENTSFPYILKNKLIARSLDLGGMNWNIFGVGKGFSNYAGTSELINYRVVLYGYNYDELYRQALIFKEKLIKHPRIKDVNISGSNKWWEREANYEYVLNIDKFKLTEKDYSSQQLYSELHKQNIHNFSDFSYIINGKYENIRIYPVQSLSFDLWGLMHYPLIRDNKFKLADFTEINKEKAGSSIYKEDQQYIRVIKYNYLGSTKFGNKYLEQVLDDMKKQMPVGYYAKPLSWHYWGESEKKQYSLILIIIIMVYFICAILFESLTQPFAIIIIIPLSFIGIFLTFYLFDFNFDQGGYASFILLSGIVVNSSIYIVNEYNNLKKKYRNFNISGQKLYLKAFNNKIVPILLTIISTVLGLVPFIVYGQNEVFWFALAVGSIGGLLFSIIVILIYLPLFFKFR